MNRKPRVPHIMQAHKSNKMPASLLFFDTETKQTPTPKLSNTSRQVLQFGYAYAVRYEKGVKTREQWCRFTSSEQFFKFLQSRTDNERPLYCFAHNLPFDLTILDFWHWSEQNDFQVDYFVLEDPPSFIIGRWEGRKIVLIDTLNYWRSSLAAIGNSIGLAKLDMPDKKASKRSWDDYGKRDVEILALAVDRLMKYVHDNDLGQFGLSAAAMAMSTYKHRFMKHEIFIHDNWKALACERGAYYGGYTDCFYVGVVTKQDVYKVDVNSMYPSVMLGEFPTKMLRTEENISTTRLKQLLRDNAVVAHVLIEAKKHTYPRYHNERFCYVKGLFTTSLCGPELRRALFNGDILAVNYACVYETAPIFRDYINFFWSERVRARAAGNEVDSYFMKLFMNMLYGKFGQRGYSSLELTLQSLELLYKAQGSNLPDEYPDLASITREFEAECSWQPIGLKRPLTLRRINNAVQIKVPEGEHHESFPAIAGYVTSYARELLLSYISLCGRKNVYYCDTDSLFTTFEGFERLGEAGAISDTGLGKLKLEGISRGATFYCPKQYTFDGKETRKGIRANAKCIAPGEYEQQQFEGVKSVLKRGYKAYIDVKTITKKVSGKYNKGVVGDDGWVIPYTINAVESRLNLE
jgi:DNA polymerase type B, organellar and viral